MPEGLNFRIAFAIAAGAIGSAFQHGFATGVLNAPQTLIEDWIKSCNETLANATDVPDEDRCLMDKKTGGLIMSWVVSIFCVGGMMGGSMVGFVSGWLGRKGGLLANNILVVIATLLMGLAKMADSYQMLIAGRLVIGINAGLNAGLAPMYLSEISPTSLRGAVGTVYQLIITISILISQVLGMDNVLGTTEGWPLLLSLAIIPAIFQMVTLPFCPESPKFLLLDKDDEMAANRALTWLRATISVHDEMDEMKQEQESMRLVPKITLKEMLTNVSLRKPLIIANMMMLAQQLSGINAAIFFSTSIFQSAGLSPKMSQSATLGMGAMNVAMTFVSLVMIEKAGRKTLMLIGLSGMLSMTVMLMVSLLVSQSIVPDCDTVQVLQEVAGQVVNQTTQAQDVCENPYAWVSYLSIIAVILFVVGFATGPGSIPWFFVTELFTQSGRPIASSIAVAVNWSANFLVGLSFYPLQLAIGPYVFIIFIVLQIIFLAYVSLVVPETKNRTVEEVTAQFRK